MPIDLDTKGARPLGTGGSLYALQHPFGLDMPLSTHAPGDTGFAPSNCFLLREGKSALLVDSGFTVHREKLLAQLDELVGGDVAVSVLPTRIGEFGSICNIYPIIERLSVVKLYGMQGDPATWIDFLPQDAPFGTPNRQGPLADLQVDVIPPGSEVRVDPEGCRVLDAIYAPLQLLPFNWLYDRQTQTLFTTDVFAYRWRETARGDWVVFDHTDMAPDDAVYEHLTHTRYWWLRGADTRAIRAGIDDVFTRFDVQTIAPAVGCVLHGADVVRAHVAQLHRLLERAREDTSIGIEIGRRRHDAGRLRPGRMHR